MARTKKTTRLGAAYLKGMTGDVEAIREAIGDVKVRTLKEVAESFGVTLDTVKTGWRPNGCPGANGSYSIAEILAWKILRELAQHGRSAEPQQPGEKALDRKRLADARRSEAVAESEERDNAIAVGNLLFRDDAERQVAELIIQARENFTRLPRLMLPRFPLELADELAAELEKRIEHVLRIMAEFKPTWQKGTDDVVEPTGSELDE